MPSASHACQRARSHQSSRPSCLASLIQERIEKRLGERIRDLRVSLSGDSVLLQGRCKTYYTKQLAQHAALGVIEDENLENEIKVVVCR